MADAYRFRFVGWGAAAWHISGALLVFFGVLMTVQGLAESCVVPAVFVSIGTLTCLRAAAVKLTITNDTVIVKNPLRTYRVPTDDIVGIGSSSSVGPGHAGPDLGQITISRASSRAALPVVASTGVSERRARLIVDRLVEAAGPAVEVQVDFTSFPKKAMSW